MPAYCNRKIKVKVEGGGEEIRREEHKIKRLPTAKEYEDLVFGWLVEAGVTSNSAKLYKQAGNSVCVTVIQRIAEQIAAADNATN